MNTFLNNVRGIFKKTTPSTDKAEDITIQNISVMPVPSAEKKEEAPKGMSNVFTDLFPKKKEKSGDDALLKSLNASVQIPDMLKQKKSDEDLLIYRKPTLGANMLKFALLLCVLSLGYFYTQLSPSFSLLGENPMQERDQSLERVIALQSKINKQNYVLAKYALDDFLYTADTYFHKVTVYESALTPQKRKAEAENEFPALRSQMRNDLLLAYEKLSAKQSPDGLPTYFREEGDYAGLFNKGLKDAIRTDIQAAQADTQELTFLRAITKLTDSPEIAKTLGSYKIQTMTDHEFKELVSSLNASNTSTFATLNSLRSKRIKWTDIIDGIEKVTKNVDPLFATKLLNQNVGEIFYSSYNFDRAQNLITVVGETISDDGTNFSVSANLIDAFENSPLFENVQMSTFTKSKSDENSYKGVLSLDLSLSK